MDTASSSDALSQLLSVQAENVELRKKIHELENQLVVLRGDLDEIKVVEEMRADFDEYQRECQAKIDAERAQLETAKASLQTERVRTMAEKTIFEENERRIGGLLSSLDDRESSLRQQMATLQEQQKHWEQSIQDLTRREELVEEWQRNHRQRENKLKEGGAQLEARFTELANREAAFAQAEQEFKIQQRDIKDREQRLQSAMLAVETREERLQVREEQLSALENNMRAREAELVIQENDIDARRKDLEMYDGSLRERERKLLVEQRHVDERDETLHAMEDKLRAKELDAEKNSIDLRERNLEAKLLVEKYTRLLSDVEGREKICAEQLARFDTWEKALLDKESSLETLQTYVEELQKRYKDTAEREQELEAKILAHQQIVDRFYSVEVAHFATMYSTQIKELEEITSQQMKLVLSHQNDTIKSYRELQLKEKESSAVQNMHKEVTEAHKAILPQVNEMETEKANILEEMRHQMDKSRRRDASVDAAVDLTQQQRPTFKPVSSLLLQQINDAHNSLRNALSVQSVVSEQSAPPVVAPSTTTSRLSTTRPRLQSDVSNVSELSSISPVAAERRSNLRLANTPPTAPLKSHLDESLLQDSSSLPPTPVKRYTRDSFGSSVSFADADDTRTRAPPIHSEVLGSDRLKRTPRVPITPTSAYELQTREHRNTVAVDASPKPPRQILLRGSLSNVSSSTGSISSQYGSTKPRMYS